MNFTKHCIFLKISIHYLKSARRTFCKYCYRQPSIDTQEDFMDANTKALYRLKVERTIKALEKNNMNGYYVETVEALQEKVKSFLSPGAVVSVGGSMTLFEAGIIDLLRAGDYQFLDRYAPGLTPVDTKALFRQTFSANAYICSTNAVTENGELYNVDGSGNRASAMIFGPDKVIVIVGTNKIVRNLEDADARVHLIAAPANNVRLNTGNPCTVVGTCTDCKAPGKICCSRTSIGFQRDKDRIHVIFVDGEFGY